MLQVSHNTSYLEVNASATIHVSVNGTGPEFTYVFEKDGKNIRTRHQQVIYSFAKHGYFDVTVTASNNLSNVSKTVTIRVYKPVLQLTGLSVTTVLANVSEFVNLTTRFEQTSDFKCVHDLGDGRTLTLCPDLRYFEDEIRTDKRLFQNLAWSQSLSYTNEGIYRVVTHCSNRLYNATYISNATIQHPIEDLQLPSISPTTFGHNILVQWSMKAGTNVTFSLRLNDERIHSSFKSHQGGHFLITPSKYRTASLHTIELQAENLVSHTRLIQDVAVQIPVKMIDFKALTTTSDFGSGQPGTFDQYFPAEYPVNLSVVPYPWNATNLTYSFDFGSGSKKLNTSDSSVLHQYSYSGLNYYVARVKVYNLVSQKESLLKVATHNSVLRLSVVSSSPAKFKQLMNFTISIVQFGTNSCISVDFGDKSPLEVFGSAACQLNKITNAIFRLTSESTKSIELSHIYTTVGVYLVHINATNLVSFQKFTKEAVVLENYCKSPVVLMEGMLCICCYM